MQFLCIFRQIPKNIKIANKAKMLPQIMENLAEIINKRLESNANDN